MTTRLLTDALEISVEWLDGLDVRALIEGPLRETGLLDEDVETVVDVVAIGKASREMAAAVTSILGQRVVRRLIICDDESAALVDDDDEVIVGEHPIAGPRSLNAGCRLLEFLGGSTESHFTLFLLSGGTSSLCALPQSPLTLEDLHGVWDASLASGIDITELNKIRAATSAIAGGGILRHVRTGRSESLIMVDNVVSGARWVASAMTYDYTPDSAEFTSLLGRIGLVGTELGERMLEAFDRRSVAMAAPVPCDHENRVVGEPGLLLQYLTQEAQRRGYRVIDMGSRVRGDVRSVTAQWKEAIVKELGPGDPFCVVGVGEVTIRVRGRGTGGRCQEFAWSMAHAMDDLRRDGVFLARATDGRDFLAGISGAWVNESTVQRAERKGIVWSQIMEDNDSFSVLKALGQLLPGGHTGWNLCDLYIALF